MGLKEYVKNHPLMDELRERDYEELIIYGINDTEEYKIVRILEHAPGQKTSVNVNTEVFLRISKETGYKRFFAVHNHPVADDNNYYHFSKADINFFLVIGSNLKKHGLSLEDLFVITKNGDFSIHDLMMIL